MMNQSVDDQRIAELRKDNPGMAVVREIDGQLVLDDPQAVAVFRAVHKANCRGTFDINVDRVVHFKSRMAERGLSADQVVVVLLNVDDINGGPLADALMPGTDWQSFRNQGQVPFARGLAGRSGIQEVVAVFDREAAEKLEAMRGVHVVVVVDHGVAEVFPA
jgi:hypothetical protein